MNKSTQRIEILAKRNKLTHFQIQSFSSAIAEQIMKLDVVKNAKVIMSYSPIGSEVNLENLNEYLLRHGKVVCYPVTRQDKIAPYFSKTEDFIEGKYGIKEPDVAKSILLEPQAIDVVLVPCVGYDMMGHRLGHGMGYYDRFLTNKMVKIAVGFSLQQLAMVVCDDYDINMDYIINEKQTIVCNK